VHTRESQQAESSAPRWRSTKVGQVAFLPKARTYLAIAAITIIVSLGFGELYLRVAYSQGMSFRAKNGPLVARFERDFRFNRYDGPSRGPEVVGPKGENDVRILIQGDSITWGQGVKNERSLYSSVLRERWRSISPNVEVAVLAGPGREIDGHLEQLGKWGDEIVPDVIVYQWFINDLELDKSHRPGGDRGWRRFVFPGFVTRRSYLWYFLDYRIGALLPRASYEDYMLEHFHRESEGWRLFAALFHAWAVEARHLTPNVLVALHPYLLPSPEVPFREFVAWMEELCEEEHIAAIDLLEPLDVFRDDFTKTFASPFDSHPNAAAHARIADSLYHRILELWPHVLHPPLDDPADQQGQV
jgi:lysophospholipase L1-like esterase